jgi:hypothetical protein
VVFSFVGYMSREENVTATTKELLIVLSEDSQILDEVVVVGYGTMKKSDLSGDVLKDRVQYSMVHIPNVGD